MAKEKEQIIPIPLSISIFETIAVSEWYIVGVIIERITNWDFNQKQGELVVSIAEYRQITGDTTSTEKSITKRLQFLGSFCHNIINMELKSYDNQKQYR